MMVSDTHTDFIHTLKRNMDCDVYDDAYHLGLYATDASVYQIMPIVVVLPKREADVLEALRIAKDHGISVLPRGGGTSLAGQAVGASMVLDFSKHMCGILEMDVDAKTVRVQPGISRDELNAFLEPYNLWFAPDPATSNRANIGGMIGNNSSGTKSVMYGKTVDYVLHTRVALSDGSVMEFSEESAESYDAVCQTNSRKGEIYRRFRALVYEHASEIERRFPKVMRRVGGYNLDAFHQNEQWNLSHMITGSEGTLAVTLEATLQLVDKPVHRALCVAHFSDRRQAIRAVAPILEHGPAAIELLDEPVLKLCKTNLTTRRHSQFLEGEPAAVLIIEFFADRADDVWGRCKTMRDDLVSRELGYVHPMFRPGRDYDDVWLVRKKGLGLLLGRKGAKKATAFIEDAAIPVDVLPEYIDKVVSICDAHETDAAVYAHASVGVIHVRPFLDLRAEADVERFKAIAEATFDLVMEYGGSWSGEHGDGLVRSPFNKRFFGSTLYGAFREVKRMFDPEYRMNPGKIVDAEPMDHHLRYGPTYTEQMTETVFRFRNEGSFEEVVHMCTGVGECRRRHGGTMCPSYKATLDETHSTRGRANALRLAMSGQLGDPNLTDDGLFDVLDLCLSCKACKSECPSNVDVAKLRSEVWQKRYDAGKLTWRDRLIRHSADLSAKCAGPLAPIINTVQRSMLFRHAMDRIAGLDRRRSLPDFARLPFSKWFKRHYAPSKGAVRRVALFADTYLNFHEPHIGQAAVGLLDACGYIVELIDVGCCQRPRISNGFLKDAKEAGHSASSAVHDLVREGIPILVCEPSCASSLQDDLPDLIEDEAHGQSLRNGVQLIEEFLWSEWQSGHLNGHFTSSFSEVIVHGHCHQKALYGMGATHGLLSLIEGLTFQEIASGCCGMAGSFGYEKEHYDLSKKIGELALMPAIRARSAQSGIIASGFSCRHQIEHFTGRKALHITEAIGYSKSE